MSLHQSVRILSLASIGLALPLMILLVIEVPVSHANGGPVVAGECAITRDGRIVCWGNPDIKKQAPTEGTFTQISGYGRHVCASGVDGRITCWPPAGRTSGPRAPLGNDYVSVSTGTSYHACGVTASGGIVCNGNNFDWQKIGPVANPAPFGRYSQVSAGNRHTCAITTGGAIKCWGDNKHGQIDAPTTGAYTEVSAFEDSSCALTNEGRIDCWGSNESGQLNSPIESSYALINIRGYPCAITKQGGIVCWGQEGLETIAEAGYTYVSRLGNTLCAVTTVGALECFGSGSITPPAELTRPGAVLQLASATLLQTGSASDGSEPSPQSSPHLTTTARLSGPTGGTVSSDVSGSQVIITAEPDDGYLFLNWEGDVGGSLNPLTIALVDHTLVTAVFALIEAPPGTSAPSVNGRIIARLLADGRIEFGFEPEGGERLLPRSRYFPANPGGGWLVSSDVELNGEQLGRITARRLADGRVEFAFIPTDGERILPSSRYFPANASVDRWLRSSAIGLE